MEQWKGDKKVLWKLVGFKPAYLTWASRLQKNTVLLKMCSLLDQVCFIGIYISISPLIPLGIEPMTLPLSYMNALNNKASKWKLLFGKVWKSS